MLCVLLLFNAFVSFLKTYLQECVIACKLYVMSSFSALLLLVVDKKGIRPVKVQPQQCASLTMTASCLQVRNTVIIIGEMLT